MYSKLYSHESDGLIHCVYNILFTGIYDDQRAESCQCHFIYDRKFPWEVEHFYLSAGINPSILFAA